MAEGRATLLSKIARYLTAESVLKPINIGLSLLGYGDIIYSGASCDQTNYIDYARGAYENTKIVKPQLILENLLSGAI